MPARFVNRPFEQSQTPPAEVWWSEAIEAAAQAIAKAFEVEEVSSQLKEIFRKGSEFGFQDNGFEALRRRPLGSVLSIPLISKHSASSR